ncbi:MAG TPA: hypothetical protein VKA43_11740 [Gammaproteobacteria bacterium]|nr:hypothetical protein [Gammaproteobacteria bacterium]
MDAPNLEKDLTISDTIIMERPGLWESTRGDDEVGYEGSTAAQARPAVPSPLDKPR